MPSSESDRRRESLFKNAYRLQQEREHNLSIKAYRELLEEFPDFTLAHYNLGVALQSIDDDESAFYAYQKAAQIDPKFTKAHLNIGVILEEQDRCDDAISVYRQALEIDPKNGKLHANLCSALVRTEENQEAVSSGELAIKCSPELARGHNNLGLAYLNTGRLESAESCFTRALALEPNMQLAMGNMAVVLHRQQRLNESRECFERVIEEYPEYSRARLNYSWLLICLGLWNESIQMSLSAMQLLKEDYQSIEFSAKRESPQKLYTADCLEALVRFRDVLAKHDIELFLVYGTLLGCMRDKDFISYDSDIDVGVLENAPITGLVEELKQNEFELRLNVNRNSDKTYEQVLEDTINLPFYYKGRIPIDVYRHFPQSDKILSGFELGGHPLWYEVSKFELQETQFLGEKFQTPVDYDRYLTECYGDWRVPTSLFETSVSSPNIVGGFPEPARAFAYQQAAANLAKKDFEKCLFILSGITHKEDRASQETIKLQKELARKMQK